MKTVHKILLGIGVIVILAGIGAIYVLNMPLAERMEVVVQPDEVQAAAQQELAKPAQPAAQQEPAKPAQPAAPLAQEKGCSGSGAMQVLVLGEATPDDNPGRGADAIRLVKVDFDAQTVHIVAFPPDMLLPSPPDMLASGAEDTITHLYYAAKEVDRGSERKKMTYATGQVAQVLYDQFGVLPDRYITVKQEVFSDAVDALGAIEITLPAPIDGRPENKGYYPAGLQQIDGPQARNFVRILQPAGQPAPSELARMQRQNLVLSGILSRAVSPDGWAKLPKLINKVHNDLLTDLNIKELDQLACLANLPETNIESVEIGPDLLTPGEGIIVYPQTQKIVDLLKTIFN